MNNYHYLLKFIIIGDTCKSNTILKVLVKVVSFFNLLILDLEMNMMQQLGLNLDQEILKLMIRQLSYRFGILQVKKHLNQLHAHIIEG